MDELTPVLSRLPEPAPPATLTATVMARIAREEERQAAAVPARRHERPTWMWAVVAAGVILGIRLYAWMVTGVAPDLTTARIGLGRLPVMPGAGPTSVALGVALLVYLAGLFAPLGRRGT